MNDDRLNSYLLIVPMGQGYGVNLMTLPFGVDIGAIVFHGLPPTATQIQPQSGLVDSCNKCIQSPESASYTSTGQRPVTR